MNGSYDSIYQGNATTAASTKSLSTGKKFSDYKWIILCLMANTDRINGTTICPMVVFKSLNYLYVSYTIGGAQINIKYLTDSTFSLVADSGSSRILRIYGIN